MKRIVLVLLCVVMAFSLVACGGNSAPQSTPEPETEVPEPQAEIEIVEDAENDDIAISALQAFLAEDIYSSLVGDYEEATGMEARQLMITDASEYIIPDLDGAAMHILMVNGAADVMTEDDTIYDRIILLVDLETGAVYDQYTTDMTLFDGDTSYQEGRIMYCMNVYNSFLMGYNDGYMTNPELEERIDLSADEIAAINAVICPDGSNESVAEEEFTGGYGGPGEDEFAGGYGGPGEDYEGDGAGYILAFSNEEGNYPTEFRTITTDEGVSGDVTVYLIPVNTEIYVETFENNILINMIHLQERGSGPYWPVGMGCLAGDDIWVAEDSRLNAGNRYTITFDEPGMWEIIGVDGNNNYLYYYFEVQG